MPRSEILDKLSDPNLSDEERKELVDILKDELAPKDDDKVADALDQAQKDAEEAKRAAEEAGKYPNPSPTPCAKGPTPTPTPAPAAIAVSPKKIAMTGQPVFVGLTGSWGGLKPNCTAVFLLAGSSGCGGAAAAGSDAGGEVNAAGAVSVTPTAPGKYKLCLSCPPVAQPPVNDTDFVRAPNTLLEVVRPAAGSAPTPAPTLSNASASTLRLI